ncbi:hypothetical protein QOT17_008332 [Balamuthia mandrillaris]
MKVIGMLWAAVLVVLGISSTYASFMESTEFAFGVNSDSITWDCSVTSESLDASCSICVPFRMDLLTDSFFSLVDMTAVKVNLGNMLQSVVGNYKIKVPASKLGKAADLLNLDDFSVDVPLADLVKPLKAVELNLDSVIKGAQRKTDKILNLANMLNVAPDLCFEVSRSACDDKVNMGIKLGKSSSELLFDVSIGLGDYLGCAKERSFNAGVVEATVNMDHDNKKISVCASLFSGMIPSNEFCFLLDDILWTMKGISFCPQISIDSSPYSNTIEFLCQTLGEIDECDRIETFKECEETSGCGWCSARRACISTANPINPCEGCPSWVLDLPSPANESTTPEVAVREEERQEGNVTVSSVKVPFLEELAARAGREEAERIEVRYCGDWYDYADETGKVSFEQWMEVVGAYLNTSEVNASFAATDENGDNVIDYKEYCTFASLVSTRAINDPEPETGDTAIGTSSLLRYLLGGQHSNFKSR